MNLKVLILSTCFSLALATPTAISSKKRPDMRIVGGEYIRIKSAPYQVSLLSIETNRAFCGGSIISSSFILTAGHCVNNLNKSDHLIIGAGSIYNDARDGVRKSVAKIFVHKKFNVSALYDFDFALLKLQTPLKLSDKIQVIELPEKNEAIKEGLGCRVSGWGATLNQNEPREILRAATLLTWNQKKCIEKLERVRDGGALVASAITDRMFCAGYVEGMIDACAGDSGGPLVTLERIIQSHNTLKREMKLIGIVSWGKGCALPNLAGVYSRVAYVRDWIDSVMKHES